MIEVIFGAILALAYAVFCPNSFNKIREKILKLVKSNKCDHDDSPRKKSKYD